MGSMADLRYNDRSEVIRNPQNSILDSRGYEGGIHDYYYENDLQSEHVPYYYEKNDNYQKIYRQPSSSEEFSQQSFSAQKNPSYVMMKSSLEDRYLAKFQKKGNNFFKNRQIGSVDIQRGMKKGSARLLNEEPVRLRKRSSSIKQNIYGGSMDGIGFHKKNSLSIKSKSISSSQIIKNQRKQQNDDLNKPQMVRYCPSTPIKGIKKNRQKIAKK